jgi:hypothetical protein
MLAVVAVPGDIAQMFRGKTPVVALVPSPTYI